MSAAVLAIPQTPVTPQLSVSPSQPDHTTETDWDALFEVEQRLLQNDLDCSLFTDLCSQKSDNDDWDSTTPRPSPCPQPTFTIAQLQNIIASSSTLPFNDIPDLPSISYDSSELALWSALLSNYRNVAQRVPRYASTMIRSGIPPPLRGAAWQAMAESASNTALESLYDSLAAEWTPFVKIIGRDLNRTFPEIKMFREKGGYGQMKLGRVLRAYSAYDIQVGYCQGLTFLAGPLLLHMDDRSAFCTLIQLMENYQLRSMFTADMAGLQLRLYQFERLFEEQHSELYSHFKNLGVSNIYASQWFLSFFAVTCPLSMLVRIFDLVFAEGAIPTIMRVALALLSRNMQALLSYDSDEEILQHMLGRAVWDTYQNDADLLITDVTAITICSMQNLEDLEQEFNEGGKPRMTNNDISDDSSKSNSPTRRKLSKRTSSDFSTLSTSSSATMVSSTSHTRAAPSMSSYFMQLPWSLKWSASNVPTSAEAVSPTSSPVDQAIDSTKLAASSTASLTPLQLQTTGNRLSIASFDSTSTAGSSSDGGRYNRVYGQPNNVSSSASSFTLYEGPTASSSRGSLNLSKPVGALSADETLILREKVASLTAEVEKLRFELQQRERLSKVTEDSDGEQSEDEEKEKENEGEEKEEPEAQSQRQHRRKKATFNSKCEGCSACDKLRMELALAKTNETLANAEIEDLRHALLGHKKAAASSTLSVNSTASTSGPAGMLNAARGSSTSVVSSLSSRSEKESPAATTAAPARGWGIW